MAKMDQDLALRIKGFVSGQKGVDKTVGILNAVRKSPILFDSALRLLEDIAAAGVKIDKSEHAPFIESVIADLTTTEILSHEPYDHSKAKAEALLKIRSTEALKHLGKKLFSLLNDDDKNAIFENLTTDKSPKSMLEFATFAVESYREYYEQDGVEDKDTQIFVKHLVDTIVDEKADPDTREIASAALSDFKEMLYVPALKSLLEMGTRKSYEEVRNILLDTSKRHHMGHNDVMGIIFKNLAIPAAYDVAVDIAVAQSDRFHMIMAAFAKDVPADIGQSYQQKIFDGRFDKFLKSDGQIEDVKRIQQLMNACPEQAEHGLNVLIARATFPALRAAIDAMLMEEQPENPDDEFFANRQQQKKLIVERLSKLVGKNRVSLDSDHTGPEELLGAIPSIPKISNDEITEESILALASMGTKNADAYSQICRILRGGRGSRPYNPREGTGILFESEASPSKALFAMKAIMAQPKLNKDCFIYIRNIANEFGDDKNKLGQQAFEFFVKDASKHAIEQIRLLAHQDNIVSFLKTLPPAQAVPELTKAFTQDAYGSMNALIDLRQAALQSGTNDVIPYDHALIDGVTKLIEKDSTLLSRIRNGENDKLKTVFDRLAEIGLIDVRQKFTAAVQVVVVEDTLQTARDDLVKTLVNWPTLGKN